MRLEESLIKIKHVTEDTIRGEAAEVDKQAKWPQHSIQNLQQEGLAGLVVPAQFGGLGHGLSGLAKACEIIGQVSASTALCFGMHCVGSAVIAAKPTKAQQKQFLEPIAAGEHITTLALSEPGTGAHFYYPQTQLLPVSEDRFLVKGKKTFVTSGGYADSYVVTTAGVDPDAAMHQFSCVVLEKNAQGLEWGPAWEGIGMRGNSSRSVTLNNIAVSTSYLLGEMGDQLWYIFHVVAPYFLTSMAGTYLGIAQAAFDEAKKHLMQRSYSHNGLSLNQIPLLQHRLGMIWAKLERTRQLVYHAAAEGDKGEETALLAILSAKAEVAHCAVDVVNEAMTLAGGIGYRENSRFDVLLRDARAAHVMSPTTDLLYTWVGRAVLEQPLLND
ncbi:acyl-CoA dehydrogenase family protein [Rhodocytophaga aerolata]|uniref:Acyl-CoA dehydrogenase family protein n=1 Tax=Rhodocytophaga aerolata TaxID=455078 RepID=A0ABT8R4I9_9BACT|nr:acyl-CoA dehydrogenase family protein [Rhodocytophaga aerolata]MDO1446854.1 acyl-CoA dehydrogenase family protein [Rhodocytophaga aerolata]